MIWQNWNSKVKLKKANEKKKKKHELRLFSVMSNIKRFICNLKWVWKSHISLHTPSVIQRIIRFGVYWVDSWKIVLFFHSYKEEKEENMLTNWEESESLSDATFSWSLKSNCVTDGGFDALLLFLMSAASLWGSVETFSSLCLNWLCF